VTHKKIENQTYPCIECGNKCFPKCGAMFDMGLCRKCYGIVEIYLKHCHKIKHENKNVVYEDKFSIVPAEPS